MSDDGLGADRPLATLGEQRGARRIVCDAKVGDTLPIGDTYGLIRFGSRVDTYFPAGTTLLAERGQRTIGAETVIAQLP